METRFILFDFDGVIADSFRSAFDVQKTICPHLSEDDYRLAFEGNVNDWKEPTSVHTEECRDDIDFFAEYIPKMEKEVGVFSGMEEVVRELEKNYTMVVVSSTITNPIKEFLEKHNLAAHFAEIMGNDVHTNKVEKIKMVFEKYEVGASDCVFITDTLGDMREAEKAGVGSIGVTWGFQKAETLHKGKPFLLVDEPTKLPDVVKRYFESISS